MEKATNLVQLSCRKHEGTHNGNGRPFFFFLIMILTGSSFLK